MLFDTYGNQSEHINEAEKKQIQLLFNSYAAEDQLGMTIKHHVCVYYDARLNDNADDPLHSILYELIKQTKTRFVKNGNSDYWKTACGIFDAFTGKNTSSLLELAKETNPVQVIENQNSFHERFTDYLDNLVPKEYGRLLVLIDELDRCKPTYAVQLLERIKHYLSNDRVTFVFAINEKQLQYTIQTVYGDGFNANQYLDKFFDYRLSLPRPDMKSFNAFYGKNQASQDFDTMLYMDVCSTFIRQNGLSLRDSIKYWNWVEIVCKSFKGHIDSQDITWKFVVYVVVPIVLGLKITNKQLFDDFLNGKDPSPLQTIIAKSPVANRFLFEPEKALVEKTFDSQNIFTDDMLPVDEFYDELLGTDNDREMQIVVSPFEISSRMSETVFTASNFMADFIKYDTNTEESTDG